MPLDAEGIYKQHLQMRKRLLDRTRSWMRQAAFEDEHGRPEIGRAIRNCIDDIQVIVQDKPDMPKNYSGAKEARWDNR